ncbi:proteasome assembly chaperone family protein [Mycetocola spongiae]|uniref:proteasome assembly chaperone family protein n=1 Tax=Mycetocola spongiae TaxID=2859226 RepID=UPI001CF33A22|nr:PAC2 family protein [Mycetocola spongiae]UCR89504.1 PAC2 family protein [Mycetocola spongiae]
MSDSDRLYRFLLDPEEVPRGLDLVVALTGYSDAGGASGQFLDYAREQIDSEPLAIFENDRLLDYRARRPVVTFDEDHLTDYTPARLQLSLAADDLSQPFLLLTGYEPDFRWEEFIESVLTLIDRLGVARTTWVHAIPMPVPHTRPLGVTVSGNRAELIESLSVWRPRTQLPANVLHLLEYRLAERGDEVAGLALLTPHYLADTQYPDVVVTAIDSIAAATGLILPTDELRAAGREFLVRINEQIGGNDELGRLVSTLEERYDTYMEENSPRMPFTDADGELPSADEIAAELESFLAGQPEVTGLGSGGEPEYRRPEFPPAEDTLPETPRPDTPTDPAP